MEAEQTDMRVCVCARVCPCRLYGDSLQFMLYHHQCVLVKKGAKQADDV